VKRVIVLGGLGLFGRTAIEQLQSFGIQPLTASRSANAELRIDANEHDSIRAALKPGDIVLDAAGPFHSRTTALIEAAIEIGFDVVDLNEDLHYAERVISLEPRITMANCRILNSASTVSAISAAVVQQSGFESPVRVTAFLVPASRRTANAGIVGSMLRTVGQPVRVFADGKLEHRIGWTGPRQLPMPKPIGNVTARLFESADSVHLPRIWPTLRDVSMYVDSNVWGVNKLLQLAANVRLVHRAFTASVPLAARFARSFGAAAGGLGYEIEDTSGRVKRFAIYAAQNSYAAAVIPAVLATKSIAQDDFAGRGLVSPDKHAAPAELLEALRTARIQVAEIR
jgi:hypothetical protein